MKAGRVLGWSFFSLQLFCYMPFLIWLWFRLLHKRSYFMLKKRRVDWVLLYSALLIVYFGFLVPYRVQCVMSPQWRHSWRLWVPSTLIVCFTTTSANWLEVTRLWLLYYELQLSRATDKQQWAVLIDSSRKSIKHPSLKSEKSPAPGMRLRLGSVSDFSPPLSSETSSDKEAAVKGADIRPTLSKEESLEKDNFVFCVDSDCSEAESSANDATDDKKTTPPLPKKDSLAIIDENMMKPPKDLPMLSNPTSSDSDAGANGSKFDIAEVLKEEKTDFSKEAEDAKAQEFHVNWYIAHLDTAGNPRWCLRLATAVITLNIVLIMGCYFIGYLGKSNVITFEFTQTLNALLFIGVNVATLVIYKKTPQVNDYIHLKKEVKYLALANGALLALFLLSILIAGALQMPLLSSNILMYIVLDATYGFKFWTTHYWVVERLREDGLLAFVDDMSTTASHLSFNAKLSRTSSFPPLSPRSTRTASMQKIKTKELLKQLLRDYDGFQLFIKHLMGEFSMECLLSTVEMVQFKRALIRVLPAEKCTEACNGKHLEQCPSHIHKVAFCDLRWPHCVPNSSIVKPLCTLTMDGATETVEATTDAFNALFDKYIADYSPLEINISARTRQVLERGIGDPVASGQPMADWLHKVSHVWDDAVTEMLGLMTHVSNRFTDTEDFDLLLATKKAWIASIWKK